MKVRTLLNTVWHGIDKVDFYLGTPDNAVFFSTLTPEAAINVYGDDRLKKWNLWTNDNGETFIDILLA